MAYPHSAEYKAAIKKLSRNSYVGGTLTTKIGQVINISNDTISAGSLYITNQCVDDDASLKFGAVYAAECAISITSQISRYSLFDAKLVLSYFLELESGSYEECKLGTFYVSTPTRQGNKITLKAYDSMLMFNLPVAAEIQGTAFEILDFVCVTCGVELGSTLEQILAMPNNNVTFKILPDKVKTYRDVISYISAILCGFCYIDKNAKLVIGSYGSVAVDTIDNKIKSGTSVSDFNSFIGSITAQFETSEGFAGFISGDPEGDGLRYEFGKLPVISDAATADLQRVLDNMMATIGLINHVPCSFTFNGDPSLELGDRIGVCQVNADPIEALITCYKWTYRGSEQIKSAGGNPKLPKEVVSEEGDTSSLEAEISSKTMAVYPYTNASKASFVSTEKEIISINYAAIKDTKSVFNALVEFNLTNDANVTFTYLIDGAVITTDKVVVYGNTGYNVVTLVNTFQMLANSRGTISVRMKLEAFESEKRKNDAKDITVANFITAAKTKFIDVSNVLLEATELPIEIDGNLLYDEGIIDLTLPTCTIDRGAIKAFLLGQGLVSGIAWDGTINMEELFVPLLLNQSAIQVGSFNESVTSQLVVVKAINSADSFASLHAGGVKTVATFSETTSFEQEIVPHADGVDTFTPIFINTNKIMLANASENISTSTD